MAGLIGWILRAVLLLLGVTMFLGALALGLLLALVWGLRALWARLTGRPVMPWAMPLDPRTVYQRSQTRWPSGPGGKVVDVTDVTEVRETPGAWPENRLPRALPGQTDADVTDIQPREPHRPS